MIPNDLLIIVAILCLSCMSGCNHAQSEEAKLRAALASQARVQFSLGDADQAITLSQQEVSGLLEIINRSPVSIEPIKGSVSALPMGAFFAGAQRLDFTGTMLAFRGDSDIYFWEDPRFVAMRHAIEDGGGLRTKAIAQNAVRCLRPDSEPPLEQNRLK